MSSGSSLLPRTGARQQHKHCPRYLKRPHLQPWKIAGPRKSAELHGGRTARHEPTGSDIVLPHVPTEHRVPDIALRGTHPRPRSHDGCIHHTHPHPVAHHGVHAVHVPVIRGRRPHGKLQHHENLQEIRRCSLPACNSCHPVHRGIHCPQCHCILPARKLSNHPWRITG